jgi:osmotically-inducible protein OsmY
MQNFILMFMLMLKNFIFKFLTLFRAQNSIFLRFCWFLILLLLIVSSQVSCTPIALVPIGIVTTGVVMSQERLPKENISDKSILAKIKTSFVAQDINNILVKISVHVIEGRVLLTGSVENQFFYDKAERIVWAVPGVHEVINELEIGAKAGASGVNDVWITGQIETKLFLEKSIYTANYSVDVNDEVVYVFGIAQDEQELEKVLDIASRVKGVKKVVNHVIQKSDSRREKVQQS